MDASIGTGESLGIFLKLVEYAVSYIDIDSVDTFDCGQFNINCRIL